jgi:hypothetical protein
VKEAAAWLGYTYLFVRMQKNPLAYGVGWEEVAADPRLEARRRALIIDAARELERCKMARFDERSGHLYITELVPALLWAPTHMCTSCLVPACALGSHSYVYKLSCTCMCFGLPLICVQAVLYLHVLWAPTHMCTSCLVPACALGSHSYVYKLSCTCMCFCECVHVRVCGGMVGVRVGTGTSIRMASPAGPSPSSVPSGPLSSPPLPPLSFA